MGDVREEVTNILRIESMIRKKWADSPYGIQNSFYSFLTKDFLKGFPNCYSETFSNLL